MFKTFPARGAGALALLVALAASTLTAVDSLPAVAATGTTYHIDCSAKQSGDGSVASPWRSLSAANDRASFGAGDQILLKRGTTCKGRLRPRGSGAKGAPIVIGAYGSGKTLPTIDAGGTSTNRGAVELYNQAWVTIQDLHLMNRTKAAESTQYRDGVRILNEAGGKLAGVTVQRLRIDSVVSNLSFAGADSREFGGIAVITWPNGRKDSGYDSLRIADNVIRGVGRTGIVTSNHGYPSSKDTNTRITGNRVIKARGDSIVVRGALNARIDHNVSDRGASLWPCKQCGSITPYTANAGIWPAYAKNTVIEYNEVYGTHEPGGDGEGIDVDISAKNTTVQYNYVHDNEGGGILFAGPSSTTVRFNIFQNNKQGAFTFIGSIPATDTRIYNNTVYSRVGNNAKVVRTFGGIKGKGVTFFNNLIYNMDDSGYYVWPTKPKTRSNTYIGVHGIGEPSEVGKQYNDPGLRNPGSGGKGFKTLGGYRPSSPKGDPAGSPIPKSVKTDFFGKKINWKKPPRGAAG